jgi:hypothetical protein
MRSSILLLVFALSLPLSASSQGLYTDSGFGVDVHFRDAGGALQYGADLGFVMRGNLEFGLGLTQLSAASLNAQVLHLLDLTPRVRFYAFKATTKRPVSLSASAGYALRRYSGSIYERIEDAGGEIKAHAFSGGLEFSVHARLARKVQWVPTLAFSLERWTETGTIEGSSVSQSQTSKFLTFTLPLAISSGGGNTIHLGPTARLDLFDGGTMSTFGFRAGFVFGNQ